MALFKVYHGDKDDLPSELKDSYGYLVVDESAEAGTWTDDEEQEHTYGVGEWYVDAGQTGQEKRYRIAAAQLIDEEGNLYTLDDLAKVDDFADDLVGAVWDGTQQESKLLPADQEAVRNSISVASDDDSISRAYQITITYNGWEQSSTRTGYYENTVTLSEALHCGKGGSLTPVPPLIIRASDGYQPGFDALADARVNDEKTAITFYVTTENASIVQSNDIVAILIDYR